MCAIVGALVRAKTAQEVVRVNAILATIWHKSRERGRDGAGWQVQADGYGTETLRNVDRFRAVPPTLLGTTLSTGCAVVIGNLRAEPTTEYVKDKRAEDQQPYTAGGWSIVHNGTIANDHMLRTHSVPTSIDSAAIVEVLSRDLGEHDHNLHMFRDSMLKLKGSYAILATHKRRPDVLYVCANYRPVWYITTEQGVFFASSRDYFPEGMNPQMLTPYTAARFCVGQEPMFMSMYRSISPQSGDKALVVCSGGLDSVVAATVAQRDMGFDVHLIHFLYGSRAEGPEVASVKEVAQALGVPLTLFPLNVYSKGDSPLLDSDAKVAGGEAGAEFAHEWVPARNLLLLSVATAFAEARGISTIVLGNNLEEAGAYPDNEPEFIARFNDLLPFAVGDGKRMRVIMPVGNLMKHEIVALGKQVDAPMHLTWSCYRAGTHHCGTCGPCFMRRKAFEINNLPEVIEYVQQ